MKVFWKLLLLFCLCQAEEPNGESKPAISAAEQADQLQQQVDELTEKLENAQRAQKQLFLIVFQVRKRSIRFFFYWKDNHRGPPPQKNAIQSYIMLASIRPLHFNIVIPFLS